MMLQFRNFTQIGRLCLVSLICSLTLMACNWREWVQRNVSEARHDNKAWVDQPEASTLYKLQFVFAWADVVTSTVYVDHDCTGDGVCIDNTDQEWWLTHEYGHVAYYKLGMPFGSSLDWHERGAQCVAEVVLHRVVTAYEPYWDCPDWMVRKTRAMMREALMLGKDE